MHESRMRICFLNSNFLITFIRNIFQKTRGKLKHLHLQAKKLLQCLHALCLCSNLRLLVKTNSEDNCSATGIIWKRSMNHLYCLRLSSSALATILILNVVPFVMSSIFFNQQCCHVWISVKTFIFHLFFIDVISFSYTFTHSFLLRECWTSLCFSGSVGNLMSVVAFKRRSFDTVSQLLYSISRQNDVNVTSNFLPPTMF